MNDRNRLMRQIQIHSFAVYEAILYLDAYPNNRRALEYYYKHRAKLEELQAQYEKKVGPLTPFGNDGCEWKWTEDAWPWEYGSN